MNKLKNIIGNWFAVRQTNKKMTLEIKGIKTRLTNIEKRLCYHDGVNVMLWKAISEIKKND